MRRAPSVGADYDEPSSSIDQRVNITTDHYDIVNSGYGGIRQLKSSSGWPPITLHQQVGFSSYANFSNFQLPWGYTLKLGQSFMISEFRIPTSENNGQIIKIEFYDEKRMQKIAFWVRPSDIEPFKPHDQIQVITDRIVRARHPEQL